MNASWFSTFEPSTWVLVTVVVVLAAWAWLELVRAGRRYAHERDAIARVRAAERTLEDEGGAEAARADLLAAVEPGPGGGALRETLVGGRVEFMARVARRGMLPSREELAVGAETQTERLLRVPRTISNVLVLVGLAATLYGLTAAVTGLRSFDGKRVSAGAGSSALSAAPARVPAAADSISPEAMEARQAREKIDRISRSIEETLAGMQTAFVPALVAVLLTITLLVGTSRRQLAQRDLLARLEEVTDAVLIPVFDPSPTRAAAEGTAAAVQATRELLAAAARSAEVLQEGASGAGGTFATAVDGAADRLARGVGRAVKRLSRTVAQAESTVAEADRTMKAAAADTRVSLEATVGTLTATVRKATTDSIKRLEEADAKDRAVLREVTAEVEKRVGPAVRNLDGSTLQLATSLAQADGVVTQLTAALDVAGKVAQQVAAADQTVSEALQRVAAHLEHESQAQRQVAASNTQLADAMDDLTRSRQAISEMLAAQQEWTRQLGEQTRLAKLTLEGIEKLAAAGGPVAPAGSEAPAPVAHEPVRVVQVADPGRQIEEFAQLITRLMEEQRAENDRRWKLMLDEHAARWSAEQTAAREALAGAVAAVVVRDSAHVVVGGNKIPWWWWPGRREPDGNGGGKEDE